MPDARRPSSLEGIKRLAKSIKAEQGLPHQAALEAAAQQSGFQSYTHARHQLEQAVAPPPPSGFPERPRQGDDSNHAFLGRCRQAWIETMDVLNPDHRGQRVWSGLPQISGALDAVLAHTRSHAHLPTGGGNDLIEMRRSIEPGCLELQVDRGAAYIVRPKTLILERIERSPAESFVLLELADLAPSGAYEPDDYPPQSHAAIQIQRREEVLELSPGDYVERSVWDQGRLGYDDQGYEIPLPDGARLLVRWFDGKILFVTKGSLWNGTPATYDGRHDTMTPDQIRAMIERSLPAVLAVD